MTVAELLKKLGNAFPAFNSGAVEAWASVFRAVCGPHEGPTLAAAYNAVLSEFSVKGKGTKTLFPVPADFAHHLPSRHPKLKEEGRPGLDLKGHAARKARLLDDWWTGQYQKIKAVRGEVIAGYCRHEAARLAESMAWKDYANPIVLRLEVIEDCEQRAVMAARLQAFGLKSGSREGAQHQYEQCRAELYAGRNPRITFGVKADPAQVGQALDQLAVSA